MSDIAAAESSGDDGKLIRLGAMLTLDEPAEFQAPFEWWVATVDEATGTVLTSIKITDDDLTPRVVPVFSVYPKRAYFAGHGSSEL